MECFARWLRALGCGVVECRLAESPLLKWEKEWLHFSLSLAEKKVVLILYSKKVFAQNMSCL